MPRIEPQPVILAEVHHGKNPARSVRFTSEIAPHLGRADVLFTGCAEAPSGAPVQSMGVRVAVYTEQRCALDKRLVAQDPGGFQRMPIVYERAVRDAEGLENPLASTLLRVCPASSILRSPVARPASARSRGPGPRANACSVRRRARRSRGDRRDPRGLRLGLLPGGALDQRTELLSGDEWILLEGLHPTSPRLQTRLPAARASARIFGLAGTPEGQRLELTADLLHIDGDEQRCTLVWRKSFLSPPKPLSPPCGSQPASRSATRLCPGPIRACPGLPAPPSRARMSTTRRRLGWCAARAQRR